MNEVNPNLLGNWVAIAFLVLNGIGVLLGIIAFFATRREVDNLEQRVASMEEEFRLLPEKIATLERHMTSAGNARVEAIYQRIEGVRMELSAKIDNVPSNVIATLKQTGAI